MNEEVKKLVERAIDHQYRYEPNRAFIALCDAISVLNLDGNFKQPEDKPMFFHCNKCNANFQAGLVIECPACKAQICDLEILEAKCATPTPKPLTLDDLKQKVDEAHYHCDTRGIRQPIPDSGLILGDFEIRRRQK